MCTALGKRMCAFLNLSLKWPHPAVRCETETCPASYPLARQNRIQHQRSIPQRFPRNLRLGMGMAMRGHFPGGLPPLDPPWAPGPHLTSPTQPSGTHCKPRVNDAATILSSAYAQDASIIKEPSSALPISSASPCPETTRSESTTRERNCMSFTPRKLELSTTISYLNQKIKTNLADQNMVGLGASGGTSLPGAPNSPKTAPRRPMIAPGRPRTAPRQPRFTRQPERPPRRPKM